MIYFVQAGDLRGPIKIGSAKNPLGRVAALSTASPEPLRLLCVIDGNARGEQSVHRYFAAERLRGEWFEPSGRLVRFIDQCRRVVGRGYENGRDPARWLLMQMRDDPIGAADQRTFDQWERERILERER